MIPFLKKLFRQQNTELQLTLYLGKRIMSKLDEVLADVADLKASALSAIDGLKAQVVDLQGKVGGVTDADLQGVIDAIDAAKAAVAADVAPAPAPVETPVEAPTEPVA